MTDKAPITPATQEAAGIPIQVAAWAGAGGVLELHNLDGTLAGQGVAVQPGTLVVLVPPPAGGQLAAALGVVPQPGVIIAPRTAQ